MAPHTTPSVVITGLDHRTVSQLSQQQLAVADQSFYQSWSAQFLHRATPTFTNLRKEDPTLPYPTTLFSHAYLPFWKLLIGFHFLFVAYSSTQNLITTVLSSDASAYIAIIYSFFIVSSICTPFFLTNVVKGNGNLSIFLGSLSYSAFILSCVLGWNWLLIIASILTGLSGGPIWVAWGSLVVTMARFIAEGDMIRDTQRRLHKRYGSDADSFESHQQQIQLLTDKLLLPNGRLNQHLLTAEQLLRLQASTIQITSMLTSLATALLSFNLVVGAIIGYFLLDAYTTTDASTGEVHVNGIPLFMVFSTLAILANLLYLFAFKTVPPALYAPTNPPLILEVVEDEQEIEQMVQKATTEYSPGTPNGPSALSPVDEHDNEDEDIELHHRHQPYSTTSSSPHSISPKFIHQSSNLSQLSLTHTGSTLKPTASFLRTIDGQVLSSTIGVTLVPDTTPHLDSTLQAQLTSVDFNINSSFIPTMPRSTSILPSSSSFLPKSGSKFLIIGGNNTHLTRQRVNVVGDADDQTAPANEINVLDGLDLDNLPGDPGFSTASTHNFQINIRTNNNNNNDDNISSLEDDILAPEESSSQQSSTTPPPPPPMNPLIGILNSLNLIRLLMCEQVILLSITTWFQQSLPTSLMYSLYSAAVVKPILGSANVAKTMGAIAIVSMCTSMMASQLMNTFNKARLVGLTGSCIFSLVLLFIAVYRPGSWSFDPSNGDLSTPWLIIIFTSICSGMADATTQTGTGAALGILLEGSPLIRGAGFALNSIFKSLGSIFIFTSARLLEFYVIVWISFVILVISVILQFVNLYLHKPVDFDLVLQKQAAFTAWSQQVRVGWPWGKDATPSRDSDDDGIDKATLDAL